MKITKNPDAEIVAAVEEGLERTGGYCPCRRERTDDTKCMCKEFREQIKDPEFEGFCHCLLYYKSLDQQAFSTACNIATQTIAQMASCQYGGQFICLTHLAPFVDVSRQKIRRQVIAETNTFGIEPASDKLEEVV